MKKYVILALLFVPMAGFSAPSVRVLGNNIASTGNNTNVVAKKATPAKTTSAATNNSAASRVGAVRAKTKTTGTVSTAKSNTESRFPVIAPNHTYSSVVSPKTAGNTTVVTPEVDKNAIIEEVTANVSNDYYNKQEVNNIVNELKEDDPRIDAIRIGDPAPHHTGSLPENYVYMWIEN